MSQVQHYMSVCRPTWCYVVGAHHHVSRRSKRRRVFSHPDFSIRNPNKILVIFFFEENLVPHKPRTKFSRHSFLPFQDRPTMVRSEKMCPSMTTRGSRSGLTIRKRCHLHVGWTACRRPYTCRNCLCIFYGVERDNFPSAFAISFRSPHQSLLLCSQLMWHY